MSHKGHFPFWKKDLGKHRWLDLFVMCLLVKGTSKDLGSCAFKRYPCYTIIQYSN